MADNKVVTKESEGKVISRQEVDLEIAKIKAEMQAEHEAEMQRVKKENEMKLALNDLTFDSESKVGKQAIASLQDFPINKAKDREMNKASDWYTYFLRLLAEGIRRDKIALK